MKVIISSQRVARYHGQLIGFNQKRTSFYRLLGPLAPRSHQELVGGIEVEPLTLDATERQLILSAWRAGKANDLRGGIQPHRTLQQRPAGRPVNVCHLRSAIEQK